MSSILDLFHGVNMDTLATISIGQDVNTGSVVVTDTPSRYSDIDWKDCSVMKAWKAVIMVTVFRRDCDQVFFDCYGVHAWVKNSVHADRVADMVKRIARGGDRDTIDTIDTEF